MRLAIVAILLFSFPLSGLGQQTGHSRTQTSRIAADRGWPRGYSLPNEAQLVLYQPQVSSWDDQKQLVALSAVSYVAKGEQRPALGTIKLETTTEVSLEQRLVKFSKIKILETNSCHRAGSRARLRRQEHHQSQERPRPQERSPQNHSYLFTLDSGEL
jgi:hypothetical protein